MANNKKIRAAKSISRGFKLSEKQLLSAIVLFALVGGYFVWRSFAASSNQLPNSGFEYSGNIEYDTQSDCDKKLRVWCISTANGSSAARAKVNGAYAGGYVLKAKVVQSGSNPPTYGRLDVQEFIENDPRCSYRAVGHFKRTEGSGYQHINLWFTDNAQGEPDLAIGSSSSGSSTWKSVATGWYRKQNYRFVGISIDQSGGASTYWWDNMALYKSCDNT